MGRVITQVQERQKEEEWETTLFERHTPNLSEDSKPLRWQLTDTFESTPESIWEDIDMIEDDPAHRGMSMINTRFTPFWFIKEVWEWEGLWDKGVFKKWKSSDLLQNDRVFTNRYVYKIKLNFAGTSLY